MGLQLCGKVRSARRCIRRQARVWPAAGARALVRERRPRCWLHDYVHHSWHPPVASRWSFRCRSEDRCPEGCPDACRDGCRDGCELAWWISTWQLGWRLNAPNAAEEYRLGADVATWLVSSPVPPTEALEILAIVRLRGAGFCSGSVWDASAKTAQPSPNTTKANMIATTSMAPVIARRIAATASHTLSSLGRSPSEVRRSTPKP